MQGKRRYVLNARIELTEVNDHGDTVHIHGTQQAMCEYATFAEGYGDYTACATDVSGLLKKQNEFMKLRDKEDEVRSAA